MVQAASPGSGGAYTYRQLEQLWTAAGGSSKLAPLMAAIAMAESGGRPSAMNPTDNYGTQTSWGLWQVSDGTHNAPPNWNDPLGNARLAVAKYKAQGLGAWGTYSSGAYKKYEQGNVKAPPSSVTGGTGFVDEAMQFLGTPYVWGGESPKGFDCSGLVQYVAEKVGLKGVPRTSEEQWKYVKHITRAQLQPGDLVFYAGADGTNASPGHVAIYAGNNKIIQAPQTGENVDEIPMPTGASGYGRLPGVGKADFTGKVPGQSSSSSASWWDSFWTGIKAGFGVSESIPGSPANAAGGISDTAQAILALASPVDKLIHWMEWAFVPNHWMRILSGIFGTGFVIVGVVTMTRTGRGAAQVPVSVGPVGTSAPVVPGGQLAPAIGIAEVTIGAVLLFVAFHNLPPTVDTFGGFIGHLQQQVQSGGKQAA